MKELPQRPFMRTQTKETCAAKALLHLSTLTKEKDMMAAVLQHPENTGVLSFDLNGWETHYLQKEEFMPIEFTRALEDVVNDHWLPAFLDDNTPHPWAFLKDTGYPTVVARADLAAPNFNEMIGYTKEDHIKWILGHLYEIDARPGAFYTVYKLLELIKDPQAAAEFLTALANTFKVWNCHSTLWIGEVMQGEPELAQLLDMPFYRNIEDVPQRKYIFTRHDTHVDKDKTPLYSNEELEYIESLSAVPVRDDGRKMYLLKMKLAEYATDLPKDRSYCVKPITATWSRATCPYDHTRPSRKRRSAHASMSQDVERYGGIQNFLRQPYIPGRKEHINDESVNTIYRMILTLSPEGKYLHTQTVVNAAPSPRVHGTRDAKFWLAYPSLEK